MNSEFVSCSGLGFSPADIVRGLLKIRLSLPDWPQFADQEVILTHQARYAVYQMCRIFDIGPGDEVLVPAFNCGAEVEPFAQAGAKVVFYKIDDNGNLDFEDILQRFTPSTRLVYVTHFFGWPQEMKELGEVCRTKGLLLVEDCALALFSSGPDSTIGRTGDAAIYSFPKSLAVPDGGALVLRRPVPAEVLQLRDPQLRGTALQVLPLLKKWFMHDSKIWRRSEIARKLLARKWLGRSSKAPSESQGDSAGSGFFDGRMADWRMSRLSRGLLSRADANQIIEIRRRNYQILHGSLVNTPGLRLLYADLPDGVCPLAFPVVVTDRRLWAEALEANGISVGGWPGYHRGYDWEGFPEARNLKDSLLTLPVHQKLEPFHMEYIAGQVRTLSRKKVF